MVAIIEHYGGSICDDAGLVEHEENKDGGARDKETYLKIVRTKTIGCAIIKRANAERCKLLLKDIRAQYSYGQDMYPKNIEKAHDMLNKYELLNAPSRKTSSDATRRQQRETGRMNRERGGKMICGQFAQHVEDIHVTGDDGRTIPYITCSKHNYKGHYSDHFPDDNGDGGQGKNDGGNTQQLQIGGETEEDEIIEGMQEFIDVEEVEDEDCDTDEGSVIIKFPTFNSTDEEVESTGEKER